MVAIRPSPKGTVACGRLSAEVGHQGDAGHTKSNRRDALCNKSDIKKKPHMVLKSAPVVGRAVGSAMMFASTSDTTSAKAANVTAHRHRWSATPNRHCNIIRA